MKRTLLELALVWASGLMLFSTGGGQVWAMEEVAAPAVVVEREIDLRASVAAELQEATKAGVIEQVVQSEKKPDITKPEETKDELARILDGQPVGELSWRNPVKHAIRRAVVQDVPVNTIVLLLLLPVAAALIAAFRHVVGLSGFGIFTPAAISVAFVATGVLTGLVLFVIILLTAMVGRRLLRRLKLQYLPRMSLMLWFVCVGVLAAIVLAERISFTTLGQVSIFPILILVLLAESFVEIQTGKSFQTAIRMTTETLIVSLMSYLVLTNQALQRYVLLNPELTLLGVAVFNIFLGRFAGLRLLEYYKFRRLVKKS